MQKLVLTIFFLSLSFLLSAQVKTGLIAGVHANDINNADLRESKTALNFHGGGLVEIPFGQSDFLVQMAALYYPLGFGESNITAVDKSGMTLGTIENHRIGYIRVPAHVLYKIDSKQGIYKLGVGPYIAFKIADRLTVDGGEKFGNGTAFPGGTSGLKSTIGGLGFHFSGEWSSFLLAVHFQSTFGSIYESVGEKWRATSFGLSFGYLIQNN